VDEFSTRLKQLLDFLNISSVNLAEKMGVQRTSFNHLLSGRNKPGFEFLTRLHHTYPSINLNWLISGSGSMVVDAESEFSPPKKNEEEITSGIDLFSNIFNPPPAPTQQEENHLSNPAIKVSADSNELEIDRLIICYKDGKMIELKQ
jgi:transcriptional regulator with XRE-family HTH domain